jgi:uncharacterized membrane protein YebE (DUF533 family)
MKSKIILTVLLTGLMSATAFAQTTVVPSTNTPKIDARETKQEARIQQGTAEANAKADGTVTKKERAKITHMQNKQSRHIKRQKHDKQTAPVAAPVAQ